MNVSNNNSNSNPQAPGSGSRTQVSYSAFPNYRRDGFASEVQCGDYGSLADSNYLAQRPEDHEGTILCYRCEKMVYPEADAYPTKTTHMIALFLGLFGLAILMFLPYIRNWGTKPVQRCPNCGAFLTEPLGNELKEPIRLN